MLKIKKYIFNRKIFFKNIIHHVSNTCNTCKFITSFVLFLHDKYGKYNKSSPDSCAHEFNEKLCPLCNLHYLLVLVCCFGFLGIIE